MRKITALITARIRRMGKVMFSLCPHLGGGVRSRCRGGVRSSWGGVSPAGGGSGPAGGRSGPGGSVQPGGGSSPAGGRSGPGGGVG